jgi:hypothetical protein
MIVLTCSPSTGYKLEYKSGFAHALQKLQLFVESTGLLNSNIHLNVDCEYGRDTHLSFFNILLLKRSSDFIHLMIYEEAWPGARRPEFRWTHLSICKSKGLQ